MDVRSAMYNLEGNTGRRNYLPAGRTALSTVYSVFAVLYFAVVASWISILLKKRKAVSEIHFLVFAALILRALMLLCEANDKAVINRTGESFHVDTVFYVAVSLGFLMNVFPRPIFAGVLRTEIDETGPKALVAWEEVLFLVAEAIILVTVMLAIVWWRKKLQKAAKTEEKAAAKLLKLTLFRNFFAAVFGYMLFFTGLVMYAMETTVSYRYTWTSAVALELVYLAFYVFVGCECNYKLK